MKVQLIPLIADNKSRITLIGNQLKIGRGDNGDLRLKDSCVSRHHCELVVNGDRAFVRDLQSSKGTVVNGHPICGEHPLQDGDILAIADTTYRVSIVSSKTKAPPPFDARLRSVMRRFTRYDNSQSVNQGNDSPSHDDRTVTPDRPTDPIDEAGLESFPASDPPAWTSCRA